MKHALYDLALRSMASGSSLRRLLQSRAPARLRTLVVPHAQRGSLGDEAMIVSIVTVAVEAGHDVGVATVGGRETWGLPGTHAVGARAGGWRETFAIAWQAAEYDECFVVGADLLDGHYSDWASLRRLRLADAAARAGAATAIPGFSFNEGPSHAVVRAFRALPRSVHLFVRDAISLERFVRHTGRHAELVADVAFLLRPESDSPRTAEARRWVRQQREKGRVLVGLNVNPLCVPPARLADLVVAAARTVGGLADTDGSVLLIPHDHREGVGDVSLTESVLAALTPLQRDRCFLLTTPGAAEVKDVCGHLDLVLSGRMHLAIASLGSGTPAVCLGYQGKFEGLFGGHFGLEDVVLDALEALNGHRLLDFVRSALERRDELRATVRARLPHVVALAGSQFGPRAPTVTLPEPPK